MGDNESQIRGGMIVGLVLVALGTLLFLGNLRMIPSVDISQMFWPVILGIWGVTGLTKARRLSDVIWPVTMLIAASLLLLSSFGVVQVHFWTLWPLALIAAGLTTLTSELGVKQFTNRFVGTSTPGRLHETAIFSGIKRRIETLNFEGGELSCVFGGIEIDLRQASLSGEAVVDASSLFGGIELRVPEEWKVLTQGFAVFGGYEDKTRPPRPEPGVQPPLLIVRGNTIFGGVSVRN